MWTLGGTGWGFSKGSTVLPAVAAAALSGGRSCRFCGSKEREPGGSGERDGPAKVLGMPGVFQLPSITYLCVSLWMSSWIQGASGVTHTRLFFFRVRLQGHEAPQCHVRPCLKAFLTHREKPSAAWAWIQTLGHRDVEFWRQDLSTQSHAGRDPLGIGKQESPQHLCPSPMYFCTSAQRDWFPGFPLT